MEKERSASSGQVGLGRRELTKGAQLDLIQQLSIDALERMFHGTATIADVPHNMKLLAGRMRTNHGSVPLCPNPTAPRHSGFIEYLAALNNIHMHVYMCESPYLCFTVYIRVSMYTFEVSIFEVFFTAQD